MHSSNPLRAARRTTGGVLAVAIAAAALGGCSTDGLTKTAYDTCASHRGLNEASWQPSGYVRCNDNFLIKGKSSDYDKRSQQRATYVSRQNTAKVKSTTSKVKAKVKKARKK